MADMIKHPAQIERQKARSQSPKSPLLLQSHPLNQSLEYLIGLFVLRELLKFFQTQGPASILVDNGEQMTELILSY